jgi:hypothetical protein
VTAITSQPAGARGGVPQGRGSADNAADRSAAHPENRKEQKGTEENDIIFLYALLPNNANQFATNQPNKG